MTRIAQFFIRIIAIYVCWLTMMVVPGLLAMAGGLIFWHRSKWMQMGTKSSGAVA